MFPAVSHEAAHKPLLMGRNLRIIRVKIEEAFNSIRSGSLGLGYAPTIKEAGLFFDTGIISVFNRQ